jgi:DNA repair protein RecN (Recombination protein N)
MLKRLTIQNYAIIDEITIDFSGRLNIITGETGAGKSILMGALSLILGDRADSSVLVNKDKKCVIEGFFKAETGSAAADFLAAHELDQEEELVLRREIASSGKSRAFINDTPATLQQLRALASLLVDLHQQFDTLELGESDFQRAVVDALAGNDKTLTSYREKFGAWQREKKALAQLEEQKALFRKELDYNQFLFDELNELSLKPNELEELDAELLLLGNAEGIKTVLTKTSFELLESEQPIVQQLKQMLNQLQAYSAHHPDLASIIQRLQSAQIELQDVAGEIDTLNSKIIFDEQRIEAINERLMAGFRLQKKHGVKDTNALLAIQDELGQKLRAVLDIDDAIATQQATVLKLHEDATALAAQLSKARQKVIKPFEEKVNGLLAQVGMPNARIRVTLKDIPLSDAGQDAIDFLFDANKSNRFEPLRKVASGGELSRLMLSIKSLVAQSVDLPTMIFDEIDTGISGEAARQVGLIMKGLADKRQIICITHQPQIAGKANAHYFVYKEIQGDAIKTSIRLLTQDERITAIARMLSGEKPTAAALENAREMIMN